MQTNPFEEKVFHTLVASQVPVFSWHASADEGWLVEFVSPNAAHVLGYPAEDFPSRRVIYSRIIHPDDLERVTREVVEHTASGTPVFEHEDYRIVDPSSHIRWVRDLTATIRDDADQVSHYFGFILETRHNVDIEVGQGTAVRVWLPAVEP